MTFDEIVATIAREVVKQRHYARGGFGVSSRNDKTMVEIMIPGHEDIIRRALVIYRERYEDAEPKEDQQ